MSLADTLSKYITKNMPIIDLYISHKTWKILLLLGVKRQFVLWLVTNFYNASIKTFSHTMKGLYQRLSGLFPPLYV